MISDLIEFKATPVLSAKNLISNKSLITEMKPMHHKKRRTGSAHIHTHTPHHGPSKKTKDLLSDTYKRLNAGQPVVAGHVGHEGHFVSVREAEYKDHKITIRTHYEIKVDGKPISGHIYVDNSGRVSSHAMPTYSFVSTVDLIKKLIDAFPTNFAKVPSQITRQKKTSGR